MTTTDSDQQAASRIVAHLLGDADTCLSRKEIRSDESLVSSGLLDSVAVCGLVRFLEEEFGVGVLPEDVSLEHFDTVQSIVALLRTYRAS